MIGASKIALERKRSLRAIVERLITAKSIGCCFRCQRPWLMPSEHRRLALLFKSARQDRFSRQIGVQGHSTPYGAGRGCFPLCEACFVELESASRRLPYYRALWERWREGWQSERVEWAEIKKAVYHDSAEAFDPYAADPFEPEEWREPLVAGPRSRPSSLSR